MKDSSFLERLESLVASDLLCDGRGTAAFSTDELDRLASSTIQITNQLPFVYTAFDGDHQMFCGLMRRAVLADGKCPANPDSILGYKETLSFRQTKRGVLLDDLSVLRGCDELWVFTNLPARYSSLPALAEGVLIEMMYFLKRHPTRPLKFVSLDSLISGSKDLLKKDWVYSYADTARNLGSDQREEVLGLSNSGLKTDRLLRNIIFYLHDPLDYKYSRFIRAEGYSSSEIPLLPYLAIQAEDFAGQCLSLSSAFLHWARLTQLASSCTKLAPLDAARDESHVVDLLERVWLRRRGAQRPSEGDWTRFKVPKASQRETWAITSRERNRYGSR